MHRKYYINVIEDANAKQYILEIYCNNYSVITVYNYIYDQTYKPTPTKVLLMEHATEINIQKSPIPLIHMKSNTDFISN